ncbi:response regulator [Paenibacillus flagellatus]|uniref:DNA-binding response regulator n=1 Tax=Paenibacillus flagellatus TaxID=2211139 RepID=A0A2V5KA20_9BACL|nr:response regulator [Paenibacillus flagellatus]PYI56268.1 DNA-binding response regulator [Paenibacillus flagellatus]
MWNVLLVEDEAFVRRSLRHIIRWEEMGFTIAGEAEDGEEALAMMKDLPPDVVISDIVMPVMDGVELLKRAREEGIESSFVMLTCMNEFEYARQALEFGASAYLLKLSMNVESLRETLAKVDRELRRSLRMRSQSSAHAFQPMYREAWQAMLAGNAGSPASPGARSFEAAEPFPTVWIGSFLHGPARFALDDFLALGLVTTGCRTVVHEFVHYGMTTFFVWNPISVRPMEEEREHIPWAAACSPISAGREWAAVWARVVRALDRAWYEGGTGPVPVPSASASTAAPAADTAAIGWKAEREWFRCFEQRKLDEFRERLRQAWDAIADRRLPMAAVKETALRIDRMLSRIAGADHPAEEQWVACVSHRELGLRLLANAERYAERWAAGGLPPTGHPEIDKALDHIHRHFDRDVTLKGVAAMVAMDETYFSGLFKKKTGDTLIHYVQKVRIGHSKGLLEQTELPVAEIGERVGFPNTNYFIKIFKRWTGTTPNEYRNRPNG